MPPYSRGPAPASGSPRPDLPAHTFLVRATLAAFALLACGGVHAVEDSAAAERASIRAERQRLEASFAAEEARCHERFAVTGCVDDVHRRRRAALAAPRSRELALIDAERNARAQARREAVARKQREAAERPIGVAEPLRAPHLPSPARPAAPAATRAPHDPAAASAEAAQRAQAGRERQEKLDATRQRIAAREAERLRRKPAAPLPVPPAAASAARR